MEHATEPSDPRLGRPSLIANFKRLVVILRLSDELRPPPQVMKTLASFGPRAEAEAENKHLG
jgi:hypothetical protein